MPIKVERPQIICRPATKEDTLDVLEFTKFTWEDGGDYIKYVWQDWLADERGFVAAAENEGHCIGIARAALSAPGQWWLEGFRVDPKYQGLGIGSRIHKYLDSWWLENGDGIARLMTSSLRPKVHHLAEKLHYLKTLELKELETPVLNEVTTSFAPIKVEEIPIAFQYVLDSHMLKAGNGLFDLGWDTLGPTEEILVSIQAKGNAYWWRDREGLFLAWIDQEDEGDVLGIGLPACAMESLPEMLLDIRRLAAKRNCIRVFWIAPLKEEILSAADFAGFVHHRQHDNYLYEKRHPTMP